MRKNYRKYREFYREFYSEFYREFWCFKMGRKIKGKSKRLAKLESKVTKEQLNIPNIKRQVDLIATLEANKVEEHDQLYRSTTSQKILEAWNNKGYFNFENDFNFGTTKISGVSFTDNLGAADRFFESKRFGERDPEGLEFDDDEDLDDLIEEFPVLIIVRENALIEDEPISLEDIDRDDLITHKEITDHIYNPTVGMTEVADEDITNAFMNFIDTPTSQLNRDFKLASKKDIDEVLDFADENFDTYLNDRYSEDDPDKPESIEKADSDTINDYLFNTEFGFESGDEIPYLLRINTALDLIQSEGEFITLEPTRIGFDDLNIYVESEEQKKALISKIPLLQEHILVQDVEKGLILANMDNFSKFD